MTNKNKNKKGFTLIELLVVVAIIGALAAVGVVAYNGYIGAARENSTKSIHNGVAKYIANEAAKCALDENNEISQFWLPTENFKVKLSYTSGGIEKEYIIEIDSIYNSETPYSEYFEAEEDLDLDFNLTDLLTHFDNIENFDFTNNEKNIITVTEDAFQLSNKTKIEGDNNDEISLPQDAVQTSSDDLYLYYALNEVEIGISFDLIIV